MATDVGQGDSETPYLDVTPAAGDTAATLTVHRPDGTSYLQAATGGTVDPATETQRWTASAPVVYNQPGRWVLHWNVTGIGESAEDHEVYVVASPVAGGPAWTPGRSRVANYVPHRTLVRATSTTVGSADTYAWTFDATTTPPGVAVDRLIADGVAWLTGHVGAVSDALGPAAAVAVSLYAAAAIERSWPNDDTSLQRARDLQALAEKQRADLKTASADADDGWSVGVLPHWSFPSPVNWGDAYL